jgi:hypothetical protein
MADEDGNGTVRFQVKDLLTNIDKKLEKIDMKLDQKADRTRLHEVINDLNALRMKVALSEQIAAELPTTLDRVESLEAWRNRIAGAVVVLSLVVLPVAIEVTRNHLV